MTCPVVELETGAGEIRLRAGGFPSGRMLFMEYYEEELECWG